MKHRLPARISYLATIFFLALFLAACSPGTDGTANSGTGAAAPQEIGPDHIEIAHKFELGKRLVFAFDLNYETDFGEELGAMVPGQQQVNQLQEFTISTVEKTPDGGSLIDFEFQRFKLSMDMGGMKTTFDTSAPQDESNPAWAMFGSFREVIGQKIRVELDAENKVLSVKGIDEIRNRVSTNSRPELQSMFEGLFSQLYVENLTSPSGLPMSPVKPGDSWPANITHNLGAIGTFVADINYQFKKMEDHEGAQCALIVFSGSVRGRPNRDAEGQPQQLMEITGGTMFGRQWFDPAIGQFTDSSIEQTMKMKMAVPGLPPEAMQGGGITLDVIQKLSRKLIRVESIEGTSSEEPADSPASKEATI